MLGKVKFDYIPDMIDRHVIVGDYVVSYNNIYEVLDLIGPYLARIKLINPSETTKPVKRTSREICKIDKGEVVIYALKSGNLE